MAWNSVKRNAWRLVKWAFGLVIGTIGFLEIAPRYEQWKATVWSLISGVPSPSTESVFWNVISLVLLIVGVIMILSDILPRVRSKPASQEVKPPEIVPVTPSAEKLKALSPIHMMIMAIERVSPREASFGPYAGDGIGRLVPFDTPNLNLDKVRSTFSEHAGVLGDHHLKEWLKFDEQISKSVQGGFWVGKSEWKWLNELEREYQETANANLPQTAPEIVVKISPPLVCEPRTLAYLLREEVPSLQVYRCQCLTVKATTTVVKSLMAKTRIDGRGPYSLNWAPKASEPASENPKRVDLFREEEVQLPIWYATRQLFGPEKRYPIELTVLPDDVLRVTDLSRLEKPTIEIAIQFIGENYTDPKPRHFILIAKPTAETWDELSLSEKRTAGTVQVEATASEAEAVLRDVAEPSVREWRTDSSLNLDRRFLHVYAVLFYPKSVSWEKGERTPVRYMARYKAVVNKKTKKAFYFDGYTIDLLNRRRIRWITTDWEGEDEFRKYFDSRGITLIREPASPSDLLEGTSTLSRILPWLAFLVG